MRKSGRNILNKRIIEKEVADRTINAEEKWKVVKDYLNFVAKETLCEADNVRNAELLNED